MKADNASLKDEMNSQITNLKESIDQLNSQLLANSEMHHADMDRLTQKIDANTQDLRTEISNLNQNFFRHLEYHIESSQHAEEQ